MRSVLYMSYGIVRAFGKKVSVLSSCESPHRLLHRPTTRRAGFGLGILCLWVDPTMQHTNTKPALLDLRPTRAGNSTHHLRSQPPSIVPYLGFPSREVWPMRSLVRRQSGGEYFGSLLELSFLYLKLRIELGSSTIGV
jgi:hypothetical protein